MKRLILCLAVLLVATVAHAGPTTAQLRARSRAGAARWNFWTAKPSVRQGLARETGRASATATTTVRRGLFGRR